MESDEIAVFPPLIRARLLRHFDAIVFGSTKTPNISPLNEQTCYWPVGGVHNPETFSVVEEWSLQVRAAALEAISSLFVGYRDHLTVTRLAGRNHFASENADKMTVNVLDVNIPAFEASPGLSPSRPHASLPSSATGLGPCRFRVEFDRAGAVLAPCSVLHIRCLVLNVQSMFGLVLLLVKTLFVW